MNDRTERFDRRRNTAGFIHRALSCTAVIGMSFLLGSPLAADDMVPSGSIRIEQVQIAFIGSGNLGGGTLTVGGRQYDFTVGGLGVGGIGLSKMVATGTVYNLRNIEDFDGAYVQGRYGLAIGTISAGELVLGNARGVVLKLEAERTGLALSLGGDAVYIDLD
nr:hypothetical protein [uncultured Dongia sp.]